MPLRRNLTLGFLTVAWLSVFVGLAYLGNLKSVPGEIGSVPPERPANIVTASMTPKRDGYSLFLFLHPECPCSMATINELGKLVSRNGRELDLHIVFWNPKGADPSWHASRLVKAAKEIPDALISGDEGGELVSQIGIKTSGTVLLYDSRGRLVFKGGITDSRGHEGDNAGEDTIQNIVTGQVALTNVRTSPVFGCSL